MKNPEDEMRNARRDPADIASQADEYVQGLPDETAEGRLVKDSGLRADESNWQSEEDKQQKLLKKPRD